MFHDKEIGPSEPRRACAHAEALRERFVRRIVGERPESVLDVGCGAGAVLRGLRRAGIRAGGVEADRARAAELTATGFDVACAQADDLPFETGSFDWVVMRHVAHHLEHPGAALTEMARVARVGLVVAEPWRETGWPEQERALRIDRWSKRQDRRQGRVHDDDHSARALAALLPEGEWELEFDAFQPRGWLDPESVRAGISERLARLAAADPDRSEGEALLAEVEQGVGVNGTVTLVARRPSAETVWLADLTGKSGEPLGRVRLARESDVPTIVAMLADDPLGSKRENLTDGLSPEYIAGFAETAAQPIQELVVVELDGELRATIQLTYLHGLSRGGATRAQIEAVRVSAEERGSGLGTELIRWAIERSRARGCAIVQLTTDKQRERAHAFYERLGFVSSHEGMKLALK